MEKKGKNIKKKVDPEISRGAYKLPRIPPFKKKQIESLVKKKIFPNSTAQWKFVLKTKKMCNEKVTF